VYDSIFRADNRKWGPRRITVALARRRCDVGRTALIFREGPSATYHSSVLTFYQYDVKRPMPAMLGIVACRAGTRMVATAVGLGYRAITGVPMIVYDNLVSALTDARAAVRPKIR
jgi:hypothetical protein